MPAKVYFHEGFYNGDTRTQFFSDFLALTTEEFDLLFEKLVGLVDESKKVRELLKCKKYEEFLELFLSE
mgnify:CR=1 FL=1